MPKVRPQEIISLGFSGESFGRAENFESLLTEVIEEQAGLLKGRLGAATYDSTTAEIVALVKRAEKALVAAELLQRRFVRISADVQAAAGIDAFKIRKTRDEYLNESERLIERLTSGVLAATADGYAGGVVESTHSGNLEWP